MSYGALAALIDEAAARLNSAGLHRGHAVGLVCANTAEFVIALLAAARAGVVVAPLDPALPPSGISARLERLGAQAVLAGPGLDAAAIAEFPVPTWELRVDIAASGTPTASLDTAAGAVRHPSPAPLYTDDDALVLFTSGTTDRPKMVHLTQTNIAASLQNICGAYELGPQDATVAAMPLFHGHGLFGVLLATLASGGCVLLPALGRFSAHAFWDDMRAATATWFSAVPTIHQILLQRSSLDYPGPKVSPVRFIRSCSAVLHTATAQAMERAFGAPVLSAYGMTETTHQTTSEPLPARGPRKPGSVGRATGAQLRVVDEQGNSCPTDKVGEVWVHGPTVVPGYLADAAATTASFTDGWFRTGDLGSLDADGYLFLTGRIKDIINRGGEKISPEHVEAVLAGCSGVTEAAVFAIPDPIYGERVGAAVVAAGGDSVSANQILRECRNQLSPYEVPNGLQIVDALPHTAKGELDRRAVQHQYAH